MQDITYEKQDREREQDNEMCRRDLMLTEDFE